MGLASLFTIFVFMQTQVSHEVLRILAYAKEEAMRTGDYSISPDHILLGILRHADNDACRTLASLGVDLDEMKNCVEGSIFRPKHIAYSEGDDRLVFSRSAQNTLNLCIVEATIASSDSIIATHLLLAISSSSGSASLKYLKSLGIDHSVLMSYLKKENLLCAKKVDYTVSILKIISSPDKIAS